MTVFSWIWRFMCDIFNRVRLMIRRSIKRKKFFSSLLHKAESGIFTEEERIQTEGRCGELDLVIEDLKSIRAEVFDIALSAVKQGGRITADQEVELNKMQQFLMIPNSEIVKSKEDLRRIRIRIKHVMN